ncbi:MAG: hypothetical protein WBP47_26440, partial [Candidatus Promineifilaceae bacterium]
MPPACKHPGASGNLQISQRQPNLSAGGAHSRRGEGDVGNHTCLQRLPPVLVAAIANQGKEVTRTA